MIKSKRERNIEVIGENVDMKTNKKWLWIGKAKQESRIWEIKENEIRKGFENWLFK